MNKNAKHIAALLTAARFPASWTAENSRELAEALCASTEHDIANGTLEFVRGMIGAALEAKDFERDTLISVQHHESGTLH